MPQSKSRKKPSSRRYQLEPAKKRKAKASPRWYGPLILAVMGVGVLVIVLNYMGLIPGTDGQASGWWLMGGLGFILAGFIGTMYWR
jgi:hypothetical protein